jgi:hypothetical protein
MAQYQIGNQVYDIPDNTPQATVDKILDELALEVSQQGNNQQQGTDGVFDFAADQFQKLGGKGIEAFGRATGLEGVEKYGTDVVKQQEIDITKGGYKSKYNKSFSDTWDEDGLEAAFGWIGEKVAENSMTTGASLVGAGATAAAALISAPAALLFGGVTLAGSALLGTGEVASEIEDKTGSYDPNLAVGVGAIIGLLDKFGAGKVIPKDQLAKLSAKQIAQRLNKAGFKEASKEFTKRTLKKSGIEFGTEGVQESLSMGASALSGGEYTLKEARDRFIDAGVVGGAMGGGVSVGTDAVTGGVNTVRKVKDGVTSVFDKKTKEPNDPEGATELANRLNTIATANDYNLQDLDKMSTKGARETVDKAHIQVAEELKQLGKDLKERLQVSPTDELSVVIDKVLAQAGQREARNKTKSTVGKQEFDAITRLTGDTLEGQRMLSLMRQMNELTELHNSGYQQGLSKITDNFSPIGGGIGYDKGAINTEKVLRPIASGGAALSTGGASLLGQLGIVAGGRAIDKLRGVNKSVVDQYIQDNKDGDGIDLGNNPSLRQDAIDKAKQAEQEAILAERQKLQEQQDREALNAQLDQENASPTPNSPQFIMEDGTGLTKQQVEEVLQLIEQTPNINPALQKAINDYRNSVRIGGNVSDLSPLIRAVNAAVEANGIQRTNPQNQSTMQQNQQMGGRPSYQNSPNYQRGIDDNRAFADELIEAVNNDNNLNVVDKPILTQALMNLKKNLGSRPMETGTRIVEDLGTRLKNPEAIQQYVVPYLDRVTQQQPNQQDNTEIIDEQITPSNFNEGDPILGAELDPFGLGDMIGITSDAIRPTPEELQQMQDGTFKPEKKQSLVEAYGGIQKLWEKATGRTTPFENTPENVEIIATAMAHEGIKNIGLDGNAIGWYDRKLKAAKVIISSIEPRYQGNEAAFDYALAVTSNGIAVADNFNYAMEVFREYLDTGRMPENFAKGGERTQAMQNAFKFFNAWNDQYGGRGNMPLEVWLDLDFTRRELQEELKEFNKANNTDFQLSAQEGLDEVVKGSYILGAKIGQGFYQNLRGNYNPLTMDIWWMRMWNRMVGRPFKAPTTEANLKKARNKVEQRMKDPKASALEKQIIKKSLKDLGLKRAGLYKDTKRFDALITQLHKNWNSYYKNYQKINKKNPAKPAFFRTVGTHVKNINEGLMATPFDAKERSYMRSVTARAIELMSEKGYNINTADYQALMWFPEKQLARKLGIQQGRGEDNDYLDAAILLAQAEGLTNDQIKETLPTTERGEFDVGSGTIGQNAGLRSENDGLGREEISREEPILTINADPQLGGSQRSRGNRNNRTLQPTPTEINDVLPTIQKAFEVGKKGSPHENGLNVTEALQIGKALGYSILMVPDKTNMRRLYGRPIPSGKDLAGFASQGIIGDKIIPQKIAIKEAQSKNDEARAIFTAIHEVSHGLSKQGGKGSSTVMDMGYGRNNALPKRTYRGSVEADLAVLFNRIHAKVPDAKLGQRIANEMKSIRFASFAREGTNLTPFLKDDSIIPRQASLTKRFMDQARLDIIEDNVGRDSPDYIAAEQSMQEEKAEIDGYELNISEILADNIAAYLIDPKKYKSIAPTAAKFLQDTLNSKPSSKFVKFYANPLAAVLAVIMSALALDDQEEEMPEGALQLGQGALSA